MLGVPFENCDLQASLHQTSVCGDVSKKELIPVTHGGTEELPVSSICPETLPSVLGKYYYKRWPQYGREGDIKNVLLYFRSLMNASRSCNGIRHLTC